MPEDIKADLRANFEGECTEVGMYLAMARVAHREATLKLACTGKRAPMKKQSMPLNLQSFLGEVVSDSTKKNLQVRVEAEKRRYRRQDGFG